MPFEDEWRRRERDLDIAFGEGFLLEPVGFPDLPQRPGQFDVNARPAASANRVSLPFTGTFVDAGAMLHAHGRRTADTATHAVAAERPMIDIAQSALPQRPQVGDIIRRLASGEVFTVQAYLPEAPTRAWIYLAEGQRREAQPR